MIFSRTAKSEVAFKDLASTDSSNFAVSDFLYKRAIKAANKTKLPYFIINENHQIGSTFGEKFSNAFNDLYNLGYKYVLALGNDCPQLTPADILNARTKLKACGAVVGPTIQKGAYLIGMSANIFDRIKFSKIDWQTELTLTSLKTYLRLFNNEIIEILPLKHEINNISDWSLALPKLKYTLCNIILNLLQTGKSATFGFFVSSKTNILLIGESFLRGPPKTTLTLLQLLFILF